MQLRQTRWDVARTQTHKWIVWIRFFVILITSQGKPVPSRVHARSDDSGAAAPAKRAVAPVAGASSRAIGSTFAGDRALNVAVARQVTLKSQRTRGVVRCDAQAAAEGDR